MANLERGKKEYKKGTYFIIGLSLGIVWGILFHNLAIGLAIGTAVGLLADARMVRKASSKPTDPSE